MPRRAHGSGSVIVSKDSKGRDVYYGKWRVDGRQVKRRLGFKRSPSTSEGLTVAQAEAALRDAMARLTPDELARLAAARHRAGKTIAEVGEAYLAGRDLKASTATDYRMHLRVHLVPWFSDTPVGQITSANVERLIAHLQAQELKPKTVRSYITTLSMLLSYAVRKGWAPSSPMAAVDLPPLRDTSATEPLRFLRVHEVNDLVQAAADGPYREVDRALYMTAALTGLRQGELRGLTWADVDWATERLHVVHNIVRGQQTSPKSRKVRSVPLAPQVRFELEALRAVSPWTAPTAPVFADPYSGEPVARHGLMDRYRKALKAAKLDVAFRFHDLRHTFGTSMAAAGEAVTTIQAWMGHGDLATTQRYMHYAPAGNEAQRIGAAFAVADPRTTAPVLQPG